MFRRYILVSLVMLLCLPLFASAQEPAYEKINVKEIILEHTGDSYGWHIAKLFDRSIDVPLPVIVRGTKGWFCFSSSRLANGESYEGFSIVHEGEYAGKVVEDVNGAQVRPIDISITKNVLSLLLNAAILLTIVLSLTRWYKKHGSAPPPGALGALEMLVLNIQDDVIKKCIGKGYERYSPYLLTAFFFILVNNVTGLIPFFPFGANTTGNIAVTFTLALFTFGFINIFASREYWKEIIWPDVPVWLKVPIPLMPVVEIFGLFTKPFALMIRLFANILGGHSIILGLVCLLFVVQGTMSAAMGNSMSVVLIILTFFMSFVELLVAFIQAYVFTMLSAVFIGLSRVEPHKVKK